MLKEEFQLRRAATLMKTQEINNLIPGKIKKGKCARACMCTCMCEHAYTHH